MVRTITCNNTDGSERPLVELDRDTPCHYALGVSSAPGAPGVSIGRPVMVMVTLVTRYVLTQL